MFMFQSIYSLVADFYNVDENISLMLGQVSLVLLAIVLIPSAFLSDFVSVWSVVITSTLMVAVGSVLKTVATIPSESSKKMFPLLFIGQVISQSPRAIALPYAGRLANLMLPSDAIARAVALGTSGFTLGLGLGYIIPAAIVTNQHIEFSSVINARSNISTSFETHDNSVELPTEHGIDLDLMNQELFALNLGTTAVSLIILIGLLVVYRNDPVPVNYAERRRSEALLEIKNRVDQLKEFLNSYKEIFRNFNFVILIVSFMLIHG